MRGPGLRTWLALSAVTVLAGAGGAAVSLQSAAEPAVVAAPSTSPSPAVRAPLLPAAPADARVPLGEQLQAAVGVALADPGLGGSVAVSVVDTATGRPLYERAASTALLPASTAKLATAIAALTALPADLRLTTRVRTGATAGEVVLVGGGDPTLAGPGSEESYPVPARLTDLARRVRASLGPVPVTSVLVDESLYSGDRLGPGWKPDYVTQGAVAPVGPLMIDGGRARPDRSARSPDPALAAGRALAALLQPGAQVAVGRGTAGPDAADLGAVVSPPLPLLVERMLLRSDNDVAEALARQVALAAGLPASFAGGARAVDATLAALLAEVGVGRGAVALVDGSGLSRDNRLQPAALARLLARVAGGEDPRLAPLLSGLPVAGFDGTLTRRFRGADAAPAAGIVRAKTGTLDGVSALAGLLRTADGRLLAFDVTAATVPEGGTLAAERALDRLATAFAACGCS